MKATKRSRGKARGRVKNQQLKRPQPKTQYNKLREKPKPPEKLRGLQLVKITL